MLRLALQTIAYHQRAETQQHPSHSHTNTCPISLLVQFAASLPVVLPAGGAHRSCTRTSCRAACHRSQAQSVSGALSGSCCSWRSSWWTGQARLNSRKLPSADRSVCLEWIHMGWQQDGLMQRRTLFVKPKTLLTVVAEWKSKCTRILISISKLTRLLRLLFHYTVIVWYFFYTRHNPHDLGAGWADAAVDIVCGRELQPKKPFSTLERSVQRLTSTAVGPIHHAVLSGRDRQVN